MRDPDGKLKLYEDEIESCIDRLDHFSKEEDDTNEVLWNNKFYMLGVVMECMLFRYGRGDQLADIWSHFEKEGWPSYQRAVEFVRQLPPLSLNEGQRRIPIGLSITDFLRRAVHSPLSFLVFMDPSFERLMNHRQWLSINPPRRFMDVMFKSFIPDYKCAPKYQAGIERKCWTVPLMNALAQPPGQRSAALAVYMNNWYRLMRRWNWQPGNARDENYMFCDFAFEVAWIVCAYDIDDSSFRNHPHYPHDLVDHYRQHIRHTRDAWRPEGVGAGIELPPPTPPKQVDLTKSKRKNFARWVELACDGYDDDVESVLEATGKPRKVENLNEILEPMQNKHAINADLKDDDSLSIQAVDMADARGIGPFEAPDSDPPQGPGRGTATLRAFNAWVTPRGYQLIPLDDEGGDWHAVLVKAEYRDEFLALSHALGLHTPSPQQAYED